MLVPEARHSLLVLRDIDSPAAPRLGHFNHKQNAPEREKYGTKETMKRAGKLTLAGSAGDVCLGGWHTAVGLVATRPHSEWVNSQRRGLSPSLSFQLPTFLPFT